MAIHHVLLRDVNQGKPDSRQFSGVLKHRFQLWHDRSYSALIQGWQKIAQRTTNPPKIRTGQELKIHSTTQAADLEKRDQIRRIRRAASKAEGIQAKANMQAPEAQAQAQVKHSQRQEADY